jgi:hypothetical protein
MKETKTPMVLGSFPGNTHVIPIPRYLAQLLAIRILTANSAHSSAFNFLHTVVGNVAMNKF